MNAVKTCETAKGLVEYSLEGNGPVVLIVHGGHDSCQSDYLKQSLIDNHFSVLIPTRPGYRGTPISSGKTAQDTADLFTALLDKLNIKKVVVIGNSAGGPTALEFSRKNPEIVEKLILEAAVVKPWFHRLTLQYYGVKVIFNPRRQRKFWRNLSRKLEKNPEKTLLNNLKLFTKLNPRYVLSRLSDEDIEALKKAMITGNDSGTGFIYDVEHRAKDIDTIRCPTLILHSKNDASVPFSHAEYAHKMIKDSVLRKVPKDSHFLYIGPGSDEVTKERLFFLRTAANSVEGR